MEVFTSGDGKSMVRYGFAEKYFDILPEGRIRRRQYLGRWLGGLLLVGLIAFLGKIVAIPLQLSIGATAAGFVSLGFSILQTGASFWMSYALGTKRINDIGNNVEITKKILYTMLALWAIVYFVAEIGSRFSIEILSKLTYLVIPLLIINCIFSLYLLCMPGKSGDNEYGKDP